MIGDFADAILLDIEGTVAPISFVHEVLFPYARRHMRGYLRQHWDEPAVVWARRMIDPQSGGLSDESLAFLATTINRLMDADVKSTGLKQLQGLIWEEGYHAGAFTSTVYADVPIALKRWTKAGKIVAIYSSGSVAAQRVFFRHTNAGDLTPFLRGYFDTTTGPKRSTESYRAIAAQLKTAAEKILFISDILEEVEAAAAAGLAGVVISRPGNAPVVGHRFEQITSL